MDRAFAFVDLCGFTAFTSRHGDSEAVQVLARFRSLTRDIASRRGVRVAKWLGDGVMLVGVDCEPIIATSLELEARMVVERSPLSIRAGMAAGEVIPFEGEDYIGTPVNLASRLCDVATSHEIVIDRELRDSIPPWASASATESFGVPGFARAVEVLHLVRRTDGDLVADPVCGLTIPRDAAGATRGPASGSAGISFCSEACADAWDGRAERARTMAERA